MELTLIIMIAVLINVFAGLKDVAHAVSEKRLHKYLSKSNIEKDVKEALRAEAAENSRKWHRYGGAAYFFTGLCIGFAAYKIHFICAFSLAMIIWLIRLVVFNPIIAVGLKQPFYYLSNAGMDGFFKRTIGEKATFIVSISVTIGAIFLVSKYCGHELY